MKIGILTYHDTFNAGAFLQTYATYEYLKNLGHNVEVIDYIPKRGFIKEYKTKIITKQPIRGIKAILSQRSFIKQNLKLSKKRIISDNFEHAASILSGYDMIIVGSDTVFEVRPDNKAFSPKVPNIYYLPPNLDCKKISFAASADKSDFSLLNDEQKSYLSLSLKNFNYLSVRDKFTQKSLHEIANVDSDLVFDPTFLLDFPKTKIKEKICSIGDFAIINVANKKFGSLVVKEYKKRNWKVVCPTKCSLADINLNGKINPLEWAELYKYSKFTVTDRFHGTIFSLKNNCPVLSIDDAIEYKNQISKKDDMLTRLSLRNLLIDYEKVHSLLKGKNEISYLLDSTLYSWDSMDIDSKLLKAKIVSTQFWEKIFK